MRVRFYISYYQLKKIKALTKWLLSMFCLYLQSGIWNNHLWQFMSNASSIALVTFFLYRLKARENDSNMWFQHVGPTVSNMLDKNCWMMLDQYFFRKNVGWKFKSVQTFIQYFFIFFMLGSGGGFSRTCNMLDQHFRKEDVNFN